MIASEHALLATSQVRVYENHTQTNDTRQVATIEVMLIYIYAAIDY